MGVSSGEKGVYLEENFKFRQFSRHGFHPHHPHAASGSGRLAASRRNVFEANTASRWGVSWYVEIVASWAIFARSAGFASIGERVDDMGVYVSLSLVASAA
jgi:hypothetical protein